MRRVLFVVLVMAAFLILTLAAAECAPINPGQTTFAKGEYEVTADITFDKPVTLEEGAILNIAKDATVTFGSSLTAGEGQIFAGEGNVRGLRKLTPEWFGAKGDGVTDDTDAFQKALRSFPDEPWNETSTKGNYVLILRNSYLLRSVTASCAFVTIQSENAWLIAHKTGEYPHLIRFNKNFCSILGFLNIEGSYNIGYGCMINVNNRHFTAHNVHIFRASLGWRFGAAEWSTNPNTIELGDSEVEIFGGATVWCLRGIEAHGGNTIIHFSNSLIYSWPWSLPDSDPRKEEWLKADTTLIRTYGGMVYFNGGCLANFAPQVPMVEIQPVKNDLPTYYSGYGGVYISNAHIEAGNFLKTANPKKIKTKDHAGNVLDRARKVAFSITGCGGYITGPVVPVNTDEHFTGRLIFENNNFYGHATPTFAKLDNPLANIKIDNTTLCNKWTDGLGAIEGGSVLFENKTIMEAGMNESQSIGRKATPVSFGNFVSTPDTLHFKGCYDASTGVFTAPETALDQVTITANIVLERSSGSSVILAILINDEVVTSSTVTGSAGGAMFKTRKLNPGDKVSVTANTASRTRKIVPARGSVFSIEASRF